MMEGRTNSDKNWCSFRDVLSKDLFFSISTGIRVKWVMDNYKKMRNKHTCRWITSRFALALFSSSSIFAESSMFLFSRKASLILLMAYVLNTNNTTCIHRCAMIYDISTFFITCWYKKKKMYLSSRIYILLSFRHISFYSGFCLAWVELVTRSCNFRKSGSVGGYCGKISYFKYQSSSYCLFLLKPYCWMPSTDTAKLKNVTKRLRIKKS